MLTIQLSDERALPLEWMALATVIYGARGSGKTTLGRVAAEEVTKANQRFCAIDLKGDWYGLKSSANGRHEGLPVVVFGGDHKDLPLEDGAGAFIADTIASMPQSTILDLEYFSKGKQIRFLTAFFERLYDANREPLLLLLDEAQRYAPQRTMSPEEAQCLGTVQDIVKLGRKHGIGIVMLTQRGSGLNKEVSELCDVLVAFRTPGPLDQARVKEWLEANVTKEQQLSVMSQLSGLKTGTAVFASGHPDLKLFGVYPVRRPNTFDSSATPKIGKRRVEPKRLAKPDLDAIRTSMAAAIERAEATDPKILRQKLLTVTKELAAKSAAFEALQGKATQSAASWGQQRHAEKLADVKQELSRHRRALAAARKFTKDVVGLADVMVRDLTGLTELSRRIDATMETLLKEEIPDAGPGRSDASPHPVMKAAPKPPKADEPHDPNTGLTPAQTAILTTCGALRRRGLRVTRDMLSAWLDIHPYGGRFGTNLKWLEDEGYLEGFTLTGKGEAASDKQDTGEDAAVARLEPAQAKALRVIQAHKDGADFTRTMLAEELGIHPYGGRFGTNLKRLQRMGLVDEGPALRPTPALYE